MNFLIKSMPGSYLTRQILDRLVTLTKCRSICSTATISNKKSEIAPRNILHLSERGLLQDMHPEASPQLLKEFSKKQCFYCGFDPTADSLHVGNLLSLMVLLHCQRAGHDVIALIGTATVRSGDPSGRFTDRQVLADDQTEKNARAIADNISYVFSNHQADCYENRDAKNLPQPKIVFNGDWYKEWNVIDFVADTFRQFRVNNLLAMRSIRDRVNTNDSMLLSEFVYQVFQSYDWLRLHDDHNCKFQIGGIDQLCNVQSGVRLIRKQRKDSEVFGLFTPLVTTPKGEKLGKSAGNSVWLDPNKTSPFEFYQYFFRQPDSTVESFLKYFTFLKMHEIDMIMSEHCEKPFQRKAQRVLARNVTKIVHGTKGLESAERCTRALFSGRVEDLEGLSEDEIYATFAGTHIIHSVLEPDTTVLDALLLTKAVSESDKPAHMISSGGVRINSKLVSTPHQILLQDVHVLANDITLVTVGKKRHFLLKWSLPRVTHKDDDFTHKSSLDETAVF